MPQPHENLVAWERADDLCVAIYEMTRARFPKEERYRLVDQLLRAAYSVPANIAEGYAFPEGAQRTHFLRIALGSLAEVGYGLHLATRIGYLTKAEHLAIDQKTRMTAAPLRGLVKRALGVKKS
jgi:four helix bundle protein